MLLLYIQHYNNSLFSEKGEMMNAIEKHIPFINWRERYKSANISAIGTDFILH